MKYPILFIPDPRLRELAKPVETIDKSILSLVDDMFEIMYEAEGVGLAATQIGVDKRIAVLDVKQDKKEQYVLINPKITSRSGEEVVREGCLSVPGAVDKLKRATHVTMEALDRNGKTYQVKADGLLAQAIQHEIDHLDGKLYIDYLSKLKQSLIRKKVDKFKRISGK